VLVVAAGWPPRQMSVRSRHDARVTAAYHCG
jgi:hypothetical protein